MINISRLYCGLAGESDNLRYARQDDVGPVVVYNCTVQCNLNCLHCYSWSSKNNSHRELTTEQAKGLLKQLAEYNCPVVLFSGGEPLLREDIFELIADARHLGMRAVLSTNGTLIDERKADRLAQAGVNYTGISIDGIEDFHDRFRGTKGSFAAALAAIENCQKARIKTGLRFTITKDNSPQVPAVFDIAANAGIRRICFYHLIRTGRAGSLDNQLPTGHQTRQVLDLIIEKTTDFVHNGLVDEVLTVGNHADGAYLLLKMLGEQNNLADSARRVLLAAAGNRTGQNIACIGPDGSVHPDQFWQNYALGNIKDDSFSRIWNNQDEPVLHKLRNKSEFADKRCRCCKWFDLCKGNFRFLGPDPDINNWLNEPACYLTDEETQGC